MRPLRRLRPALRDTAFAVAKATGRARPRPRTFSIITFHRVVPGELRAGYPLPGLAVTPRELAWALEVLGAHYTLGPIDALYTRYREGDRPPRPFCAVTFDDGQWDNVEHAAPVLERAGLRATFYLPTDFIGTRELIWHDRLGFAALALAGTASGRRALLREGLATNTGASEPQHIAQSVVAAAKSLDARERLARIARLESDAALASPAWARMMTWDEARALVAAGHELGSHSCSHPILPLADDASVEREVARSKEVVERETSAPCDSFCYPNGDHDRRAVDAARRAGYRTAVTTTRGTNDELDSPFTLHRYDMHPDHMKDRRGELSAARLLVRLAGRFARAAHA